MRLPKLTLRLQVLLAALLLHPSAFAQGPLTPPGPPGPTMKTLQQLEPRTPITNLPVTISQPGSYYLTTNLTCVACLSNGVSGIVINAPDVTLDLMGFELVGVAGSGRGVISDNTFGLATNNIVVRNGTVRGWGLSGVDLTGSTFCRVENIRALRNAGDGIAVGYGSSVIGCLASTNGTGTSGSGISATDRCVIRDCVANDNRNNGISVVSGCVVVGNFASGNGSGIAVGHGIKATGGGNRIEANQVRKNFNCGIFITTNNVGNVIVRNTAGGNSDGDYCGGGNDLGPVSTQPATATSPWANFSSIFF